MSPTTASNIRIPTRLQNKLAYGLYNTNVQIEVRHKSSEPPLLRPWPDATEFEDSEIGWQDQVIVTVNHNFALLPGPGRFLAKPAPRRDTNAVSSRDAVADHIRAREWRLRLSHVGNREVEQRGSEVGVALHSIPYGNASANPATRSRRTV